MRFCGAVVQNLVFGIRMRYLHENCAENPSKHLLGLKTHMENNKYVQIFEIFWLGGKPTVVTPFSRRGRRWPPPGAEKKIF